MARQCTTTLLIVALCVCLAPATQAAERIIYVDQLATGANDGSSWHDAYVRLRDALAEASEGEPAEIRVAEGTYRPNDGVDSTSIEYLTFVLPSGVFLRGGYSRPGFGRAGAGVVRDAALYPTILHAVADAIRGVGGGRFNRVVTVDKTAPGTQLDGVTIAGGYLGMEIVDANLAMTGCVVKTCQEDGIFSQGAKITLADCYFRNNTGKGLNMQFSDAVLSNCRFERNGGGRPTGGALYGQASSIVATHCQFIANEGSVVGGSGALDLARCDFNGNNTGGHGGVVGFSGTASMRYCRFESNAGGLLREATAWLSGEAAVSDCEFTGNTVSQDVLAIEATAPIVARCSFVGNVCTRNFGNSIFFSDAVLARVSTCLFTGNRGGTSDGASIGGLGVALDVSNCTFASNRDPGAISGFWDSATLAQCILGDASSVLGDDYTGVNSLEVMHSNVEGGYPGLGNIDVDPLFVQEGYWANPDDSLPVWVAGDYHLQSQAGHWDRGSEVWVLDEVTSLCIDAGDPNGYLGAEPFPNGGYVNLGAYGGTAEASRSYFGRPVCENQLAGDINGDCVVDQTDMDILLSHWLMNATDVPGIPPAITIVSPADGDAISYPDSIDVQTTVADSDGYVARVEYRLARQSGNYVYTVSAQYDDASGDWFGAFSWRGSLDAGAYTLTVTAVDNEGNETTSAPITITLLR